MEVWPSESRSPVEISVAALNQSRRGDATVQAAEDVIDCRGHTIGEHLECTPKAVSPERSHRVKKPIGTLNKCRPRTAASRAAGLRAATELRTPTKLRAIELMDRIQRARRAHDECRAVVILSEGADRPAGCPVEIAVTCQNQRRLRVSAVNPLVKLVERGDDAIRADLKHRTVIVCSPQVGRPLEKPIRALDESRLWDSAVSVSASEAIERGECARGSDRKHGTRVIGAPLRRRPVEIAVASLDKRRQWHCPVQAAKIVERRKRAI